MSDVIERLKKRIEARKWKITDDTFIPELIGMQYANNMNDWCLEIIDEELAKESQECNSDLISKRKLIDSFNASINTGYETFSYDLIVEAINNQPQVQQWIPCSERLPSSDGMFLVTVKSRSGKRIDLCHFNKNAKLDSNKWGGQYYNRNVIAWQPIPSVWKGENNAEK